MSLPICVFIGFLHFLSLTIHHRYRYSLSFYYSCYYSTLVVVGPIHHQNRHHHHRREIDSFDHRNVSHAVQHHHPYDQGQVGLGDNYHCDHGDSDRDNFHGYPRNKIDHLLKELELWDLPYHQHVSEDWNSYFHSVWIVLQPLLANLEPRIRKLLVKKYFSSTHLLLCIGKSFDQGRSKWSIIKFIVEWSRSTCIATSTSSANSKQRHQSTFSSINEHLPMNIVLNFFWQFIIDDMFDGRDVETTGSHTGCH